MILNQKNIHILSSQQPPYRVGVGALTKWNKWSWLFFGTAVAVWLWYTFIPSK